MSSRIKKPQDVASPSEGRSPSHTKVTTPNSNHSPFKWKLKLNSSSSTPSREINKKPSYGYLIDEDTLNILTNNISPGKPGTIRNISRQSPHNIPSNNHILSQVDRAGSPNQKNHRLPTFRGDGKETQQTLRIPNAEIQPKLNLSVPPPPFNLLESSSFSKGPASQKVRNFLGADCIFCGESLHSLFMTDGKGEKTIEMECGHIYHEECYRIVLEFESGMGSDETEAKLVSKSQKTFNIPKCKCGKLAKPVDDQVLDEFLAKQVTLRAINHSKTASKSKLGIAIPEWRSAPKNDSRTSRQMKLKAYHSHNRIPSRGSSISAISSIISSVSESPISSPTSEKHQSSAVLPRASNISVLSAVPLAITRSRLVSKILADSVGNADITDFFIDSLGLLRLLDKLSIAFSEMESPTLYHCYLFSYLLLLKREDSDTATLIKLVSDDDGPSGIRIPIEISRLSHTIFKATFGNDDTVYISISQESIMNKWIDALEKPDLNFSKDKITETIVLDNWTALSSPIKPYYSGIPNDRKRMTEIMDPNNSGNFMSRTYSFILTPPKTIILVFNQYMTSQFAITVLRNVVRALFLIKINVLLVISSVEMFDVNSNVVLQQFFNFSISDDDYNEFWEHLDFNSLKMTNEKSLAEISNEYLKSTKYSQEQVSTVVLSSLPLSKISPITYKNLFIEVGVLPSSRRELRSKDVIAVASWDEVMECLCMNIGLDFDMVCASDTDLENDSLSMRSRVSALTINENNSTLSYATESDSDAEVITGLLADYERNKRRSLESLVSGARKSFHFSDKLKRDSMVGFDNKSMRSEKMNNSTLLRWSALISDIDKALEESKS